MATNKNVYHRLFKTDTVNSLARRLCDKKKHLDSLDLVLSSVYNHETDLFVSKFETVLQIDNAKYNATKERLYDEMVELERNNIYHPLVIGITGSYFIYKKSRYSLMYIFSGGISERKSPHSVKLICSGHHTPITNPGYSRQSLDGNIFKY